MPSDKGELIELEDTRLKEVCYLQIEIKLNFNLRSTYLEK